ncbi:hypothetical protein P4654_26990 [Niallia taxi]|uniref:hypothetical protein n=1 Tax=Niallia taxi TaxID=2499688 RepID=UPI002E241001|nr:hypothetical protein [Niallia taxi]MED4122277.1 hypothetical protein [Niallia taxi]
MSRKVKIKVNELEKVYLLEIYGLISYIDEMIKLVFLTATDQNVEEIKQLPFVIKVSDNRTGSL